MRQLTDNLANDNKLNNNQSLAKTTIKKISSNNEGHYFKCDCKFTINDKRKEIDDSMATEVIVYLNIEERIFRTSINSYLACNPTTINLAYF